MRHTNKLFAMWILRLLNACICSLSFALPLHLDLFLFHSFGRSFSHSLLLTSYAEILRSLSGGIALYIGDLLLSWLSLSFAHSLSLSHAHNTSFSLNFVAVPLFSSLLRAFFFYSSRPFWFHKTSQYLILVFKCRPKSIDISLLCACHTRTHIIYSITYIVSQK